MAVALTWQTVEDYTPDQVKALRNSLSYQADSPNNIRQGNHPLYSLTASLRADHLEPAEGIKAAQSRIKHNSAIRRGTETGYFEIGAQVGAVPGLRVEVSLITASHITYAGRAESAKRAAVKYQTLAQVRPRSHL